MADQAVPHAYSSGPSASLRGRAHVSHVLSLHTLGYHGRSAAIPHCCRFSFLRLSVICWKPFQARVAH